MISLTPVRSSLEEYYIQKLRPSERQHRTESQRGKPERRRSARRGPQRGGGHELQRIGYIAFNTFREAVRDRVLYNLIAFAVLLSGAAILVGEISIDIETSRGGESGSDGGIAVWSVDRDFYRDWPGF